MTSGMFIGVAAEERLYIGMNILYTDSDVIVCLKPAGVLSEGEGVNCLPSMLSEHLSSLCEDNIEVFPVHRLDKETAGVMVFARTSACAAKISEDIKNGNFIKQYLAVVHGTPQAPLGTLVDLLFFDRTRLKSFVVTRERKGVKKAVLDYSLVATREDLSLLKIRLHTGRTHQIRSQLSSRGLPLVGDRRYGAPKSELHGIALLSQTLSFPHPITREELTFSAPVPKEAPWSFFEGKI